jgi:subtilisin family serine protease
VTPVNWDASEQARSALSAATGRGVRVAVIDSGVHAAHPHVGGVAGGIAFSTDGRAHEDFVDRLGHGTAVIAAIKEKAPDAEIYAVKVFDAALATSVITLVRAIDWAVSHHMHVINLSLGTPNPAHDEVMRDAARRADFSDVRIVSANPAGNQRWLPGALPGVVGVDVDWDCPRERYAVIDGAGAAAVAPDAGAGAGAGAGASTIAGGGGGAVVAFRASGYPRDIPGVSREQNLKGVSFAVANMTGFVARALQGSPSVVFPELIARLRAGAAIVGDRARA